MSRQDRKKGNITLVLSSEDKAFLEKLALGLGEIRGENKPNISKLFRGVATGKYILLPAAQLRQDYAPNLRQAMLELQVKVDALKEVEAKVDALKSLIVGADTHDDAVIGTEAEENSFRFCYGDKEYEIPIDDLKVCPERATFVRLYDRFDILLMISVWDEKKLPHLFSTVSADDFIKSEQNRRCNSKILLAEPVV